MRYKFFQKAINFFKKISINHFVLLFLAILSLCAYPALFIYFYNVKEAVLLQTVWPTTVFIIVSLVSWLFFGILSGNIYKGAFIAILFVIIFIRYKLFDAVIRMFIPDFRWWRIAPLLFFILINFSLLLRIFIKKKEDHIKFFKISIIIGAIFLGLTIFNAMQGIYKLQKVQDNEKTIIANITTEKENIYIDSSKKRPNFYFFIFDEYSGRDALRKMGYDNTSFLKGFEAKKFNVSYSTNPISYGTITATGNLLYYSNKFKNAAELTKINIRPPLFDLFKIAGYKVYALSPVFILDKDIVDVKFKTMTVLTNLSIEKTVFLKSFISYLEQNGNEDLRAERMNYLKKAMKIIKTESIDPKFLFFHLLCPHEPFVFDENGDPVAYENMHNWVDYKYYIGQLKFISDNINKLSEVILATDPNAIVIIQSDHGARGFNFRDPHCLNILYLQGKKADIEGLSPINTLRLALNYAFDIKLNMLRNEF
jgi:hypothetical protein